MFRDEKENIYRVERASNGKHVAIRINQGKNRKLFKPISPSRNRKIVLDDLVKYADMAGWVCMTEGR